MEIFGFDTDKRWDYENGFYLTSDVSRMGKALAQWELYKMIVDIPGDVVECGVYKGSSLIRWITYRDVLEGSDSRKVWGFDTFKGFPETNNATDKQFIEKFMREGGKGVSKDELDKILKYKNFKNYGLVKCDLRLLEDNPVNDIALLNIDVDTLDSTWSALWFTHLIVPGGILILDDYGKVEGATKAVEKFFDISKVEFSRLPFPNAPAYLRKKELE